MRFVGSPVHSRATVLDYPMYERWIHMQKLNERSEQLPRLDTLKMRLVDEHDGVTARN